MIKANFENLEKTLKNVCGVVVEHLEDGSMIFGHLTEEEKNKAHQQAKENLNYLVDQITQEINKDILKNILDNGISNKG